MLAQADEILLNAPNEDTCLLRIEPPKARWTTVLGLGAACAVVLSLVGGIFLVTTEALSKPDALHLALAQPLATLQIVAGLMLLTALVLVPVRRLIAGVGHGGSIEIDGGIVRIEERGLFSSRTFDEPLDAYCGVAHRIRTTLSGLRHEIVLVHPDARRDVVIALDRIEPAATPASMIARLGLPQIAPADIARRY
jgi:hypothetical protein